MVQSENATYGKQQMWGKITSEEALICSVNPAVVPLNWNLQNKNWGECCDVSGLNQDSQQVLQMPVSMLI